MGRSDGKPISEKKGERTHKPLTQLLRWTAFPPHDTLLASGSWDATVRLWVVLTEAASGPVRVSLPTEQEMDETPSIWYIFNLDSGLDLESPGTREFFVDVDAHQRFIWPFYWCATDEATLPDNLKSMTVEFLVDDAQVPAKDILEYDHESGRLPLLGNEAIRLA